jgi:hypothetical protein
MTFIIGTVFSALAVSAVAAYFSIVGLMAIFSALPIAILSMGVVLEIAKLVTASWIYQYWQRVSFLMKTYMVSAVVILSIITSIGIFGFLSKAHLDQAAVSGDAQAKVERVEQLIERENGKIAAGENRILRIQQGSTLDVTESIRQQEETRDKAWERIQGDITYAEEQIDNIRSSLDTDLALKQQELDGLDAIVASYTNQGTTTTDAGAFRRDEVVDNVALGVQVRERQREDRDKIDADMSELRTYAEGQILGYRNQIIEYRTVTQGDIDNATNQINRLRENESQSSATRDVQIDNIQSNIDEAYDQIGLYNEDLFEERAIVRELSKEVGPVRYVAQFLYGDDTTENIDRAVVILILLLIFVFDPLAIMLVIAANLSIKERLGGLITPIRLDDDVVEKESVEEVGIKASDKPASDSWQAMGSQATEKQYDLGPEIVKVTEDMHIDIFLEDDATLEPEQMKGTLKWQETTENKVIDDFKPAEDDWVPAKYGKEAAMDPIKEKDLQWLIDSKKEKRDA